MKIYVGNISHNTSENELTSLFGETAKPMTVKIIKDRDSGRSRGFGFAEFETNSDGNDIINKFNGYSLDGFQLKIAEAKEREERPQRSHSNW